MIFDLPVSDEDQELDVGIPTIGALPELTEWENKCSCCCFDLNYIPKSKQYFINHWKIRWFPFTIVNFIIWSSYLVYLYIHSKVLEHSPTVILWITVYLLLFDISYFMIIYEGPGYLPFYYPLKITKQNGPKKDYLSGVVSTKMQEAYVKGRMHLNRCNYFDLARRYVIRPDHFCGWTGSFIGKKNHKLFFLFNFWGLNYITLFLIFSFLSLLKQVRVKDFDVTKLVFTVIYIFAAIFFISMTLSFTLTSIYRFTVNITQFEIMKRKVPPVVEPKRIISNFEEVFGPASKWYLWLLPIPAFHGIPEEDLLDSYSSML